MLQIYYSTGVGRWPPEYYHVLLQKLPATAQEKIERLKRQEDRQQRILGKILLQKGLKNAGFSEDLSEMQFTDLHKPFFANGPHFNISHTAGCVVCVLSVAGPVGIDVEKIRPVATKDFQQVFTPEEWKRIESLPGDAGLHQFFRLWTKKEAVIKADGRGMYLPLEAIDVRDVRVELENTTYFFTEVPLPETLTCFVASPSDSSVRLEKVTREELINNV